MPPAAPLDFQGDYMFDRLVPKAIAATPSMKQNIKACSNLAEGWQGTSMDNAVIGFFALTALVVSATLGAMFASSTAVLYHQEDDQAGHYTCTYVTATGTISQTIWSSAGCDWLITVGE